MQVCECPRRRARAACTTIGLGVLGSTNSELLLASPTLMQQVMPKGPVAASLGGAVLRFAGSLHAGKSHCRGMWRLAPALADALVSSRCRLPAQAAMRHY